MQILLFFVPSKHVPSLQVSFSVQTQLSLQLFVLFVKRHPSEFPPVPMHVSVVQGFVSAHLELSGELHWCVSSLHCSVQK